MTPTPLREFTEGRLAGYQAFLEGNPPSATDAFPDSAVSYGVMKVREDTLRRLLKDFDGEQAELLAAHPISDDDLTTWPITREKAYVQRREIAAKLRQMAREIDDHIVDFREGDVITIGRTRNAPFADRAV